MYHIGQQIIACCLSLLQFYVFVSICARSGLLFKTNGNGSVLRVWVYVIDSNSSK